ncbi:MAG: glycosyltransferase family 4 protein [Phycisphaeraceae bacterium]
MARRILFIAENESAAATRYRALHYFDRLRGAGYEPVLAIAGRHRMRWLKLRRSMREADAVVLLRQLPYWPVPSFIRRCAKRLIYDFDDAIYVHEDGSPYARRERRWSNVISRCDGVWAGNDVLAGKARQHNAKAIVIPTAVDVERYAIAARRPSDTLDLVWIGSSATRKYLETVLPALEQAASDLPQLRLKIIADFDLPSDQLRTKAVRWSAAGEAGELASSHIGIAPLSDNAWTRGKCGLKVIQCMAAGLPMIASPVSVQKALVRPGETGFLAASAAEWIDAIKTLAANADRREELGRAGAAHVRGHYSEEVVFAAMMRSLDSMR